ncbi:MAG: cysteine desulfurase family protein [Planctomycetales bacterium]
MTSAANPARPIYLDHQATTPVDPRVLEAMLPWLSEQFGNASSIHHAYGRRAADAVEQARGQVAELLNVDPRTLIFTSGATESNNLALKGVLRRRPAGAHLVVNAAEHRAILDPAKALEREGFGVTVVPVDHEARVHPDQIASAIQPNTVLVSVMAANNEVGTLNPLPEIAELCHDRGVWLHTDAAQYVGKLPLDLNELPVDLLSLSGHKIYGPQGIGALYVRREGRRIVLRPLFDGGGHEQRMRSGTLPVPLIVGLGAACEIARREMSTESPRLADLSDRLWQALNSKLTGMHVNGPWPERLPGNLNVSFDGVSGEALLASLTEIAVSSGSACTSADPEPSHVLRAMGLNEQLCLASLRFGVGRFNTTDEIDRAADHVIASVSRLRHQASR